MWFFVNQQTAALDVSLKQLFLAPDELTAHSFYLPHMQTNIGHIRHGTYKTNYAWSINLKLIASVAMHT